MNKVPLSVFFAGALLAGCSGSKEAPEEKPANRVSVETVTAERGLVQSWVFSEGTARAARREYLTFEDPGLITFVKEGLREGSEVKEGDVLVRQDQRRLLAELETARAAVVEAETQKAVTEAELVQAKTDATFASKTQERFATLLKKNSASQQEFDEAKARTDNASASVAQATSRLKAAEAQIASAKARVNQTEIEVEQTELKSPIDGVVARLNVQKGFYITPSLVRTDSEESYLSTIPVLVLDTSSFEITVDIPPVERDVLEEGKDVFLLPGGGQGEYREGEGFQPSGLPVTGSVYSVTPSVSPGKRALQVKIRTGAGSEKLQDGMFSTAWISARKEEDAITVPLGVFIYRENKPHVFVVDPKTKTASLRKVSLGIQGLNQQEIADGIEPGEMIVTAGLYQLSEGTAVSVIEPTEENPEAETLVLP